MISHGWLHNPLQNEVNSVGITVSLYRIPWRLSFDRQISTSWMRAEQWRQKGMTEILPRALWDKLPSGRVCSHDRILARSKWTQYKKLRRIYGVVKQIFARPEHGLTSNEPCLKIHVTCLHYLPQGAVPYLLDLMLGYKRHQRQKLPGSHQQHHDATQALQG